jgi:GNAT superfamily N-acetyltransferase
MPGIAIQPIRAEETRPFRQRILRPHLPPEHSVYPGDDAADSLHVGAFVTGRLVGVATVLHEPRPSSDDAGAWRLRGVAVEEAQRGQGIGRRLVEACIAHVRAHGGTLLWFNAASAARRFYEGMGFEAEGEEGFSETGGYYRMWKRLH